jgi:thiol-disulfide isomerase/thioredoxin
MKKTTNALFSFVLMLLLVQSAQGAKVNFASNAIAAKEMARKQGKIYFYDFVAKWCMPCRWMDETTYTDPELARYINENIIPVKIDIDDFDGFALKQKYKVEALPTIIVFSADGKVLARYTESMPPSKLMSILKKYNTPANGQGKAVAPSKAEPKADAPVAATKKPNTATKPSKITPSKTTPSKTYITSATLYSIDISRQANKGFSVQVGSYTGYDNVTKFMEDFKNKFNKELLLHVEQRGTTATYKILLGNFKKKADAEKFAKVVKAKGTDCIVKDLSALVRA